MSAQTTHLFDHAVEGAAQWIDELAVELGTDDPREARRVLRVVLHAVRDHLEPNEAAQFAAQLPELVRGMYYAEWVPGRRGPRRAPEFLEAVAKAADLAGITEASFAVSATMRLLERHVTSGELDDVLANMPAGVRAVLLA